MSSLRVLGVGCVAVLCLSVPRPAGAQCPGNCDNDARVAINDLITCVNILLGGAAVEQCVNCDPDGDGTVQINELITAVNFALGMRGSVQVSGECYQPSAGGLGHCADGTPVSAYRCDEAASCLTEADGRTLLESSVQPTVSGQFAMTVSDCRIFASTLIFIADIDAGKDTETQYRVLDIGPAAQAPSTARLRTGAAEDLHVVLSPGSEAGVRVLDANGLENFSDEVVKEILDAAESANAETDFAGTTAAEAATLATDIAEDDPAVLALIEAPQRTPTPSRTVTSTRSSTSTSTPRPTFTPTPMRATPTATSATPSSCPENGTLPEDSPASCDLNFIGDRDVFRFTLSERTRVRLQATEVPASGAAGWQPCISLLPDLVGGAEIAGGCDSYHPGVDVVLEAATYYVVVSDQGDDQPGDYEILYQPLSAATAVTLPVDEPLTAAIGWQGDYDLYSFTLAERTRVRLQATELPPDGGGGWTPCLYVYAEDDGAVMNTHIDGGCDTYHPGFDRVLEPGTYYALVLEEANYILGDYEILYQPLSAATADELPVDEPLAAAIGWQGDYDLYTFTLAERTRVRLQATELPPDGGGGWAPCLFVYAEDDDGAAMTSPLDGGCESYHPGVDRVLDPGTYYVLVLEQGNYVLGDYEILYQPLSAATAVPLPVDEPLAGAIGWQGDYDLYSFTLAERTRVRLQATEQPPDSGGGWTPCLFVYAEDDDGAVMTSNLGGGCDSFHPGVDVVLDPGTYYALVHEQSNYILGEYDILYQPLILD